MRELVAEALAEGARGLSVGLIYSAVFSETEEIVEIARALRPYGWAYHATIRDYGAHLLDAVREAIHVAETAEVPLVVAHMYPAGREYWGQADAAIELLERARDRGLETGYDVTPWPRGGGPMLGIVPAWARKGGHDASLERLRDPALRSRIGAEIEQGKQYSFGFGWDDMIICRTGLAEHRAWLGRSIGELARESGRTPPEAGLLMLLQDDGQTWIAPTNKCDEDVDALLRHPMGVPIADGFALAPEGPLAYQDRPNSYGTFPRVLGRYVRERGVLTWEEAVGPRRTERRACSRHRRLRPRHRHREGRLLPPPGVPRRHRVGGRQRADHRVARRTHRSQGGPDALAAGATPPAAVASRRPLPRPGSRLRGPPGRPSAR